MIIAPKATKTVRSILLRIKDKDDKMKNSNVIYSIPCLDCHMKYIGQTKRYLETRIHEHEKTIERIWENPERGPKNNVGCGTL